MTRTQSAVLFSGGIDSTALACQLAIAGHELHFLNCDLGKPYVVPYAKKVVEAIGDQFNVPVHFDSCNMGTVYDVLRSPDKRFVPGYRSFYALAGLAFADKLGLNTIYSGEVFSNFSYDYKSLKEDVDVKMMAKMLGSPVGYEATPMAYEKLAEYYRFSQHYGEEKYTAIVFSTPLYYTTKPDRVRIIKNLNGPLDRTLTCVNQLEYSATLNKDKPYQCGKGTCYFCNQRRLAFLLAEVEDPSEYRYNEELPYQLREFVRKQLARKRLDTILEKEEKAKKFEPEFKLDYTKKCKHDVVIGHICTTCACEK
jgi:7-cyano-7-deazaguanine synthase in queuosine biosynthesis